MAEFTPLEAPAHEARHLPVPPPVKLIGRDITLARIYAQIKDSKAVLVHGPAGVGKSALAATLASAYTEQPGGVLYLVCDSDTVSELIVRTGRALRVAEAITTESPLNAESAVAAALQDGKPLIVLDGLLNPEATAEFIRRCAPDLPVLLLNDQEFTGEWLSIRLGKLEPDQAVTLFKQVAGIDSLDLDGEIGMLASVLNYTPLALTVAAAAVREGKLAPKAFQDKLQQPDGNISAPILAITTAFGMLPQVQQGVLMLLGSIFTGSATLGMIQLLVGAQADVTRGILDQLTARGLIESVMRNGQPAYRIHSTTRVLMTTALKSKNQLDTMRRKVAASVLQYAKQHSAQGSRGQNALAAEMNLFLATASWAAEEGDRDTAAQLAAALMQAGTFVRERGYVYELLLLRRLSSSSTSAFPAYSPPPARPAPTDLVAGDEEADEEALDDDEDLDLTEGDEDAVGEADEADEAEPDDEDEDEADESPAPIPFDAPARPLSAERRQQVEALIAEGRASEQAGDAEEALKSYAEALALSESGGDTPTQLSLLEAMARVAARSENAQAAVSYAGRGIKLADDSGDDHNKARLLGFLGDARQQLGEGGEAVTAYEQALAIVRAKGDRRAEGVLQFKLGYAQLDEGDVAEALVTWQSVLELFRAEGRRDYEGRALGGIGTAYSEQNRWPEAIEHFTQAVQIARETEDDPEALLELSNLAYALVQNNQLGPAVTRYRQALHLAYSEDDAGAVIATTVELCRLLVESPRHLAIAELLVNAALQYDPHDHDLKQLQERIEDEREAMPGLELNPAAGTARDYAAKAWATIDQT
ncbi:MAG: tetratricopeptide repeat protein [Anaerolineae bacterium]|nr:tetratricopeptide repeat protein [Anaerolineae bacterium]